MEKPQNIDTGGNKSVNVIEKLIHIENSLKINDDNEKSSDDLISAKFKFEALRKQNNNSPEAQSAYEKVLHNFDKLTDRQFLSKIEYINATKKLIEDLSNIKLNNGKSLKETRIDGGLYDSTIALYEGVKKAGIKIYEELKQNLKTLVSPEEWKQIANSLMQALKNPIEFVDNILKGIKEYAGSIYDYINIVMQNSTKKGFATEMSKYLPETGIPLLISSVGPGKFFKILKITKYLPEKLQKIFGISEKIEEHKNNSVNKTLKHNNSLPDTRAVNRYDGRHPGLVNRVLNGEIESISNKKTNLDSYLKGVDRNDLRLTEVIIKRGNYWINSKIGNLEDFVIYAENAHNYGFNETNLLSARIGIKNKVLNEGILPLTENIRKHENLGNFGLSNENRQFINTLTERINNIN